MSGFPQINSPPSQQWADHETEAILLYFTAKKSEIGDAGNFKKKTYVAAAETIRGQTRTWEQVKTKWHVLKTTYRAIQIYQETSGVHWDAPENELDIGRGANITTEAEAQVWDTMIKSKKNHPMKPFRNRGWRWLWYMERIIPVAGATGMHSFAPTEADPRLPTGNDQDEDFAHETSQAPAAYDDMDIDAIGEPSIAISTSTAPSTSFTTISSPRADTSWHPAPKRPRSLDDSDTSKPRDEAALSVPSDHSKKSKLSSSEKGKGKAKTSSNRSATRSLSSNTPSTTQRVNKITPAVALVELHGSIKDMTEAILVASKPPESSDDKAMVRCQEAVRLVQERDDGLSVTEKAALIVFFGDHHKEVDMYIALKDDQLRQAVIKQWIGNL